ncbi:MAG: carbohydrate-selective porin OprB [Phenylobacterium sp.]
MALAVQLPHGDNTVGMAVSQTWSSNKVDGKDTRHAELYYRLTLSEQFALTASVQYLHQPWFGGGELEGNGEGEGGEVEGAVLGGSGDSAMVYGLRVGWFF